MKINMQWVYRGGEDKRQWKYKEADVSNNTSEQIVSFIVNLLAKEDTIRIIFTKGE